MTVLSSAARQDSQDVAHPPYNGKVLFQNKFDGQLPAADYPKVTVSPAISVARFYRLNDTQQLYMCLFFAYLVLGCAWAWLCYQNIHDLLPIQYYLSSLVGFLVIEMIANWGMCITVKILLSSILIVRSSLLPLFECTW